MITWQPASRMNYICELEMKLRCFFFKKKKKKQALRDVQSTACLLSSWCVLTRERAITRLKRTIFYFTKFIIEPQQV